VQILSRLKPQFIHDPRTRFLLRDLLLGYGCNASNTYQDVPRLRAAYPASYLTTGIAYAHHPHRDTWYSAPPCQLNWWMPLYDFDANQGMAFHPAYWDRAIANGSSDFNYYRWNAVGRQNAAWLLMSSEWVGADEALRMGLVWRVCDPDELLPEARRHAEILAARPISSLMAVKHTMVEPIRPEIAAASARENAHFAELMGAQANAAALADFNRRD